ncbi:hypothetical protein [Burkholderia thailandensis]|uniref:hypothetical protein n=1 Tax=Burkholderia thailandensis TaxID=57975 RepID=UPI00016A9FAF|nr:hypothetical protein [Burkholderia thailandensis]AHI73993.1 hypothetical protein BTQ_949 [Burkholderia thailandensis 2002721723]AIP24043.1 hypothetical protein DR63_2708 [Burkholderia thailandensis E264]AIS95897.1 hypothetical protein BTHA_2988 [Burkholderia thailandensis MSMB59]AIT21105.1 hypothetical protein BTN_1937 [Burkholderia thailandensis E254]AJX98580.1 hypothetical protein BG87_2967 [Burkholderia thailandensis 2002721643]
MHANRPYFLAEQGFRRETLFPRLDELLENVSEVKYRHDATAFAHAMPKTRIGYGPEKPIALWGMTARKA